MTFISLLLDELERESARTARVLEQAPPHKTDWKPHERSMPFGALSQTVATMPSWLAMIINMNELDLAPPDGQSQRPEPLETPEALVAAHAKAVADARAALEGTNEHFLQTTSWKLLVGGNTVWEAPRHVVIRDTIDHWSHHRGQMTVYLRLMGAKVPAIYGPSADDNSFA